MHHPMASENRFRSLLVWIGLAFTLVVLGLLIARLAQPGVLPLYDFIQYWAAGRLNAMGGNPYAPDQVLPLQRALGWKDMALTMMYPPWTLSVMMPFGMLSYPVARLSWLILHLALLVVCTYYLWRFYEGEKGRCWVAWLIGLTFMPALHMLRGGQVGTLILLGLVGFLLFERSRKDWLAGMCTVLVAIKPHLLYLFWIALLLWAIKQRRWSVLLGGVLAILVTTAIALAVNPSVLSQYLDMMRNPPPAYWVQWASPTFGGMLRKLFGPEKVWLQFISPVVGALWFGLYWRKRRHNWRWEERMPLVLLVSLATTPYGWSCDQVVLLVALIQAFAWLVHRGQCRVTRLMIASYGIINGSALILHVYLEDYWFVWLAPSLLLWYWAARQYTDLAVDRWIKEKTPDLT